jgi:hypothetical protein
MSRSTSVRRAGTTAVAISVAVSLAAVASPAQAAPADRGAHWLSDQLTNGIVVGHGTFGDYNDYGLSIDTAFALRAIGGHRTEVRQVRHAMSHHVGDYIGAGSEHYAGPTAKLLVLAETTGGDPTSFGGVNLIRKLNRQVTKSGDAKGRIADTSKYGDYANTVGQILAVRGLTAAKSGQAVPARRFLLKQQCRQGYFRLNFSKITATHQGCRRTSPADPDTTAYAVIQLWKTSRGNARFRGALKDAVTWLARQQRRNGSYVGGTSTATPNTNSTGLAAWALGLTGHCSAAGAAATWVAGLQVGAEPAGSKLAGERGAIAYDKRSLKAGRHDGIVDATQDQWRRATSQAAPGLLFRHGC